MTDEERMRELLFTHSLTDRSRFTKASEEEDGVA